MLAAIKGYYDGNQIIVREKDRKNLSVGDEVIITILDNAARQGPEKKVEKRTRFIETGVFAVSGARREEEIDQYLRELREILEKLWEL